MYLNVPCTLSRVIAYIFIFPFDFYKANINDECLLKLKDQYIYWKKEFSKHHFKKHVDKQKNLS